MLVSLHDLEARIRKRCEQGDREGAATVALRGYGPEVFGFLVAMFRSQQDAGEVFSIWSEAVWRSLPAFAWECSFRTWAFVLARRNAYRFRLDARKRARRDVHLTGSPVSQIAEQVRSATATFLQTAKKSRLEALRDALSDEDKTILILRVDRRMSFAELARVTLGEDEAPTAEALQREAARLRKRFQLVKERLIEAGKRQGLLGGDGEDP